MSQDNNCEKCTNYEYDEEYETYFCQLNLDEDELVRFNTSRTFQCPYFRFGDEYTIVRKQI